MTAGATSEDITTTGSSVTKKAKMVNEKENELAQLKEYSVVVADTGDFSQIQKYAPEDSTTNPTLLLAAAKMTEYAPLVSDAIAYGKAKNVDHEERLGFVLDRLAVNFGVEILKIVNGVVSTEIDARLSFDTEATVARAKRVIAMYEEVGIAKERILIKIASTWEGIKAAEILKEDGIMCNLTLLFSFVQAVACAEAGVKLISPFVGRIRDWYVAKEGRSFEAHEDPGVLSVTKIYNYFKKYGYETIVMGASFRSKEEIVELAGCDKLTIPPKFLEALQNGESKIERKLNAADAKNADVGPKLELDEKTFRWMLNEDQMATQKLCEGINLFSNDLVKLEKYIEGLF